MRELDIQMAKLVAWLGKKGLTANVDRHQRITLRDKATTRIVYEESRDG